MRFDPADGSTPAQSTVKTGTLAAPPQQNPQREGFRFDGWTLDGLPFDLRTPILQDTTLTAQWSKTTDWTLSPDHGPASGARLTISPPDRQEPYYTSIHSAGDQIAGLTGDGRIYTWTKESTPMQVPFPAQASDGFHYLQATAGSQRQAALGSDQHIYTWNSQQPTPTTLDTGQNVEFTSISINDDRLLAVDQQGRIHAFQTSLTGSQNLNPKFTKQTTTRLRGKAQAVTAVPSGSLTLVLDTDGKAWTWDTSNTGKAKPTRIRHDPDMHIIQAQALNQGFLLLDTDGHAWYLADNTTDCAAVSLPEGVKASRITANKDQAMITGKDGRLWAWKPGKAPKRADKEEQAYAQAASTGSRVTALSKQGNIFTWSLDAQGQPGRPARLDTTQAPTLESASMDSHALTLSRNNDSWQAYIPAHKPGPAAITITGKQDSQPFTRNLNYTVDQPLTRAAEPRSTLTVRFDTGGGKPEPADQNISDPYGRVKRPSPDPARQGFLFDGWFIGEVAYDFSRPVDKDLTLAAHWTPAGRNSTWSISPDKGSQLGRESTTITPPDSASRGIRFSQVSGGKNYSYGFSLAVGSDGNAYAWGRNDYGQLGDGTRDDKHAPVMVRTPDRNTYPDLPEDFTYVQVSAGWGHSLALGSDGYVYAWGSNTNGELGNNITRNSAVPVRVTSSPTDARKWLKAIQVSAGYYGSLSLDADGNIWAWGYNNWGQLGNNSSALSSNVPVRVRDPNSPTDASKGLKAIQVSNGGGFSLAIDKGGNIWAWGYNCWGQLGNNTSSGIDKNPVPVRVRDPSSPTDASKGLKAVQVSAGGDHSLAIDKDGSAWAWGRNVYGQLGNDTTSPNPGTNSVPARVRDPSSPTDASKGLKAVQVSAGHEHSLAIDKDGNTWAWGYNQRGQLGNNTTNSRAIAVKVYASTHSTSSAGPWLNTAQISAGGYYSLSIGTDGYAKAWGDNGYGQLGDDSIPTGENNTKAQSLVPVPVMLNLQPVITGVRFDQTPVSGLTRGDGSSVSVLTPAHQPGMVTVSVDYTLGGAPQKPDTSLRYTYLPAGVLPRAGGEGILLALATGMTGMGGVLASRRHRREQHQLSHASHE